MTFYASLRSVHNGAKSCKNICSALKVPNHTLRLVLDKLKSNGSVVSKPGSWLAKQE